MSVATLLGIADPEQGHLAEARTRWPQWCQQAPELAVAGDLVQVSAWLLATARPGSGPAARDEADGVLHALARLGSPRGGDDLVATAALAYLLLPGASLLAGRLQPLCEDIDQLVAAQLWLEIRTFAWERLTRVAANILLNTRKAVLRDLIPEGCTFLDPTTESWEFLETVGAPHFEQARENAETAWRVRQLFRRAVTEKVITEQQRALLMALAEAATDHTARSERGIAGLYARPVLASVAKDRDCSVSTIRRRAQASLHAVAGAYGDLQVAS
jgi:hypothetical protein